MKILIPMPNFSKYLPEYIMYLFIAYTLYLQFRGFMIPGGVTILGAIVLGTGLVYMMFNHVNFRKILTGEVIFLFVFYYLTLFPGIVTSPTPSIHIDKWTESFLYFLLSICLMYMILSRGTLDKMATFFCLIAFVSAITLLLDPVLYRDTSIVTNIRYSLSEKLNVNTLGTYFSLGCWCMLYLITMHKKIIPIGIIFLLIVLPATNMTGSRKNLIAIIILIVMWIFFVKFKERKISFGKKTIILLCAGIGFILLVSRFFTGSMMELRMQNLINSFSSGSGNYNRLEMYRNGWYLFLEHPVFGVGFYGYAYYFGGHSHTTIIEVLSCTGIVGFIIYFGMYAYSMLKVLKLIRITNGKQDLYQVNLRLRVALILWVELIFFATCIIHIYLLVSFFSFGILFSIIKDAEQMIGNYYLTR